MPGPTIVLEKFYCSCSSFVYSCYVESKTIITLGLLSDLGHTFYSAPIPFHLKPKIIDTLTHDG